MKSRHTGVGWRKEIDMAALLIYHTHQACLHKLGSCSFCFSPASRWIVVVVCHQMHICPINRNLFHLNLDPQLSPVYSTCLELIPTALATSLRTVTRTHHPSVFAAIKNGAQKCRQRMPETVAERQLLSRSARTNRGMGRVKGYRYEPRVFLYEIVSRWHL